MAATWADRNRFVKINTWVKNLFNGRLCITESPEIYLSPNTELTVVRKTRHKNMYIIFNEEFAQI